jgi:hypothetical protein
VNATDEYQRLERQQERAPNVRDHSARWDTLQPVASVNGDLIGRIETFCAAKRITPFSLTALETRIAIRRGGSVWLAFAGRNGAGAVTAIKYRPLDGTSHDTEAEPSSVWLRPIAMGKLDSLAWFVAEGETDGARLYDLVGDVAAVLVLPAGAKAFKPRWADVIPRGATVHLCHDADEAGDEGADKTGRILGGKTVRVRPPLEGGDWCDWAGGRDEFVQLVKDARGAEPEDERPFSMPIREFIALERPAVEPLIVDTDGRPVIAQHSLTLLGALGGAGKTTLFVELALHLAAGVDYLNFSIPAPASVLLIENEGPEEMFALKLEEKLDTFPHPLKARLHVCTIDWGGFTLGDDRMRQRLREELAEHEYDLVFGDPLDSLGIEGVGSPEDTRKFFALMKETGLHKTVAWWLNTHPRKEETREALNEIAGAWGGKPDAVLLLKMLADDRSQVRFPKLRWAKRGKRPAILLAFDVATETFTFLAEEEEVDRDYLAEIVALLADERWRTPKEIAAKKDADEPGIGAADSTVKMILETHPDTFESLTGDDAKQLGRHPSATVWQLVPTLAETQAAALELQYRTGTYGHPIEDVIAEARRPA